MSRVLVVSTYELGTQPLGAAGPAAVLGDAGHEVRVVDLSVETMPADALSWCDAVVCSVPMHTALRLALAAVKDWRRALPSLAVCYLGLYAPAAAATGTVVEGDAAFVAPGGHLLDWLAHRGRADASTSVNLERPGRLEGTGRLPERAGLPGLSSYARMVDADGEHLVASLEASTGCNHRCRHCPVPIVYEGRSRPVALEEVAADLDRVVGLGASHVRFADPDFLNRPQHALRVASMLHRRHPDLGFDATIKVSHLLRHADLLGELAACGLRFVVSAFESTSDVVLARLDKGHRGADLGEAVLALRAHGVEVRPSLLPFTPWTVRRDLLDLFDFVAAYDLVDNVDPIQYSIRLLLPPGSLLLGADDPVLAASLGAYDPEALGIVWTSADAELDELQRAIARRVEADAGTGEATGSTYGAIRSLVFEALGAPDRMPTPVSVGPSPQTRPRLTEAWFCCAEPNASQLASVKIGLAPARAGHQ